MRHLLLLALLLGACADAPDEPATADPSAPSPLVTPETDQPLPEVAPPENLAAAPPLLSLEDLGGDWVFCSGDGALDEAATVEGAEMRTYLHDRPALVTSVKVSGDTVLFDGRTYRAARDGEALRLEDDLGTSVYARSAEACP